MENTGHISLSRQLTLRRELDIVANNLANLNTNAYRGERLAFAEHLMETENGDQLSFVQGIATVRDLTPGPRTATHNDLDIAIEGDGYFEVEDDGGLFYTRDGAFGLNDEGELVTRKGQLVMGVDNAPIRLFPVDGEISISKDGVVSAGDGPLGQIKVVRFEEQELLVKLSGSLYDADGQRPEKAEDFSLLQGFIEGSNVIGIAEMTRMMQVAKDYRSAQKLVENEHRRQQKALDVLGARIFS